MGTNYYVAGKPVCDCCGRGYPPLHIGKSNAGWHFSLHVYPELGLDDLAAWETYLQNEQIVDNYGKDIPLEFLLRIIKDRYQWDEWTPEELELNCAEKGLNGLARHKIDGTRCIGHGEGTWDYIATDFS